MSADGQVGGADAADLRPARPHDPPGPDADPSALAGDLAGLIDRSPTPWHAADELAGRLERAGFTRVGRTDRWPLAPGARLVVVDGGTVLAVRVGEQPPSRAGVRLLAAHTDSPGLRLRPAAGDRREGCTALGSEVYGSPLLHTWLDRDLTLAGRAVVADPARPSGQRTELVALPGAPLRLPSLAVHLHREVATEGLRLDRSRHVDPIWSAGSGDHPDLHARVAGAAGVDDVDALLGAELCVVPVEPCARGGADGELLSGPRLDDLTGCHAAVVALAAAEPAAHTQAVALLDHEEVGSRTAEGAAGPGVRDLLARLAAAVEPDEPQAAAMAAARTVVASCDTAHAVHPGWPERHDRTSRPVLGGGPVRKTHASRAYATDAPAGGWLAARAADAGVALQEFTVRGDLPCGSTVGPVLASGLGAATVDLGAPLLAMHAVRELAHVDDHAATCRLLAACLAGPGPSDG